MKISNFRLRSVDWGIKVKLGKLGAVILEKSYFKEKSLKGKKKQKIETYSKF